MAQPQGPNKRTMVVLCTILGILAVVAVFRFMSLGGGGGHDSGSTSEPAASTRTTPAAPPAAATTVTTEPPGEPVVPTGDFDALATRDPFEPVVELNTTSASEGSASTAPTSASSAGGSAAAPTPAPSGTRVLLVDVVDVDGVVQAQLQVNGQPVTVAPGQTFATSFKLVSISGTCAQLLYGDAAFSLCKGEEAVK